MDCKATIPVFSMQIRKRILEERPKTTILPFLGQIWAGRNLCGNRVKSRQYYLSKIKIYNRQNLAHLVVLIVTYITARDICRIQRNICDGVFNQTDILLLDWNKKSSWLYQKNVDQYDICCYKLKNFDKFIKSVTNFIKFFGK